MKKVIIFTSDLYQGGVAESTRKIVKVLSERADVTLCSYDSLPINKELPASVNVKSFNLPLSVGFRTSAFGRSVTKITRFLALPIAFLKLRKVIKETNADVVYSMTYIPNILNVLCSKYFNYKCILSERQDPREDLSTDSVLAKVVKKLYPSADVIHVNSEEMNGAVSEFYEISAEKLFHFDNFFFEAELNELANQPADLPMDNKIKLVTSGRLSKQKGQWHLIELVKELRSRGKDVGLLILGEGELRDELIQLACEYNISEHIHMIGNVDNPHSYVKQCDLFIFPSLWESFGNTLVEAMALKVPVASTVCRSGPKQIIEGGKYGMSLGLLPYHGEQLSSERVSLVCDKLETLLDSELSKYGELSYQGYSRFDAQSISKKIYALFLDS
ncbi:glycosyltransferase [Pseudoalteromonas luteoviolacea]|uniref:Glycosyl transferase family 1 domain-containing protein n=1 Tax=Pseudoalteromonas luteoviolacea H33 TaxID=1365251 RepID=A0A167EYT1_9GAMM|nr:glycosyltransferase [Pseudoalteromonas luteoviolacea]KZN51376.1 hypothetical protein N476_13390 [Pseudoalteromonas luteoviolacea H33]KZN71453.1 hypothetical protein N477_04030 [Pseudoalteromonas luteoviolacea H33-S]MBQ4876809.1 glycosyltransferase [Pseudoalteromonas luteoviolacea]MBQ4905402.1 glycosyltransferase [Pseudoalteromonas luteoviolacea]